jgi:hypothetical protein
MRYHHDHGDCTALARVVFPLQGMPHRMISGIASKRQRRERKMMRMECCPSHSKYSLTHGLPATNTSGLDQAAQHDTLKYHDETRYLYNLIVQRR